MKISDQQKENMPSTNNFMWVIPAFLFIAWLTKVDVIEVPRLPIAAVGNHAAMHQCDTATICLMGWSII